MIEDSSRKRVVTLSKADDHRDAAFAALDRAKEAITRAEAELEALEDYVRNAGEGEKQ